MWVRTSGTWPGTYQSVFKMPAEIIANKLYLDGYIYYRTRERTGREFVCRSSRWGEKDQVCASEEVERPTNEVGKYSGTVQQPSYIAVPIGPPAQCQCTKLLINFASPNLPTKKTKCRTSDLSEKYHVELFFWKNVLSAQLCVGFSLCQTNVVSEN